MITLRESGEYNLYTRITTCKGAKLSGNKIVLEFDNRDHSTVVHSYDKINNEIQNDENNIRQVIEDIKNKIVN